VLPPVSQAEPLTDEQIVEQCMAAGIKWIAPDDDPDGYPGGFDMCSLADVRKLLEGATPSPEVKASATPGEGA
jgi:hypothetical protein